MESALRDRDGNLWFATAQGLSRLAPAASAAPMPPAVLITGLQAGGAPRPVSQRGETSISGIRLEPSRNQLQVEFVALSGEPETNLLYSYKLEGATNWKAAIRTGARREPSILSTLPLSGPERTASK
jgi:hypothetical protein